MTFQPTKPQAQDLLSQSVTDIQQNFTVSNNVMAIDHYPFDNVSSVKGYHKQVRMPELLAAPTTAPNEGATYTKVGTNPAETNLFYRGESNGFEYQLTKAISASTGSFAASNNGWSFLPGRLLIQWGRVNAPGTSGTVTFPVAFSAAPYTIQITLERNSGNQSLSVDSGTPPTSTAFSYLTSSGGSSGIYWLAIGVKA